jgi:hypothetical protein
LKIEIETKVVDEPSTIRMTNVFNCGVNDKYLDLKTTEILDCFFRKKNVRILC